jgi:Ca-activated chloride channel family protein
LSDIFGAQVGSHSTLKTGITLASAALLVAAIARPYFGAEDIEVPSRGNDVVFLVDISQSMYARDIPPSRLEVAKRKIKDLVALLSANGSAARFGITVFAGDGYTVCPVTNDRGVVGQFIDIISPELVSSLGSNLQAGIEASLGRVDEASKRFTRVILLSDGEDQFLQAQTLVKRIHASGVRFDVIGVGLQIGAPIQLPSGATVVDQNRAPVVTKLNEESLKAVADAGGGIYVKATLDDSDVQTLAQASLSIAQSIVSRGGTSIRVYREIGAWLALAALTLLIIGAGLRGANPLAAVLIVAFSTALIVRPAWGQATPNRLSESPYTLYEQGEFSAAAEGFAALLKDDQKNHRLRHGLGSSLYKLGKLKESEEVFRTLADETRDGRVYFESVYNQGNALLGLKRYQDAIDAYRKALDVKPDDERAQHNLLVARARQEEEKRRALEPTPTPTLTPTPSPTPSARETSQSEPSPSPSPSASASPSISASPSPAASPEQTSAASPSPADTSEPKGSPSPNASPEDSPAATMTADSSATGTSNEQAGTPAPTASAAAQSPAPAASPTPDERLKEAIDKDAQAADPSAAGVTTPVPQSSAFPEVDAWLQSLPDSPLLIRKQRGRPPQNGQTW